MQSFPSEKEGSCALFADEIPDFFHHWVMIQYHLNPILEELPFRTAKRDTRTLSAAAQDKYQKFKKKKERKHGGRVQWPQYQLQKCSTKKWKHFWVYPYALWDKRPEKAGLLVIYKLQMEILTASWRNL